MSRGWLQWNLAGNGESGFDVWTNPEARRAWCAARQAGTSCTSARTDAFWPVVATVARESVIPSACYTQPRLTYALELFAIVGAPGARREASPASSSLLAHMGLAISTAVL
jgi:hypothetical protein